MGLPSDFLFPFPIKASASFLKTTAAKHGAAMANRPKWYRFKQPKNRAMEQTTRRLTRFLSWLSSTSTASPSAVAASSSSSSSMPAQNHAIGQHGIESSLIIYSHSTKFLYFDSHQVTQDNCRTRHCGMSDAWKAMQAWNSFEKS